MGNVGFVLAAGMTALGFGTTVAADDESRARWGQVSVNLGINLPQVQDSDKDCFGGQAGVGWSMSHFYLRGSRTSVSYEAKDRSDSCDGLFWGDSDAIEHAWTGGVLLGRSGWFLGAGLSDVHVRPSPANTVDFGRDHGKRYELGYTTQARAPGGIGLEALLFYDANDVRNFGGIAFGFNLGS
jgi:hypothetical protein